MACSLSAGYQIPEALRTGPYAGGTFNLLAFLISLLVTFLLVIGTSKSAKVNAVLVMIKVAALTAFIFIAVPAAKDVNFQPFFPTGWGSPLGGIGVLGAAASIFFAYVGFDAVSTAAEETKNPQPQHPDRPDRFIGRVHDLLHAGELRRSRRQWRPADDGRGRTGPASGHAGTGGRLQRQ